MAVKVSDVRDIVKAIGGEDNLQSATHCVTRLRLVLNDDSKVDKEKLDQNPLVKGQFKADHQYQIVIGPGTVDEVYKVLINETGTDEVSKDEAKAQAAKKGNPLQRLIKLLGDIFIPILPAIVTAGLLLGINNVLTMPLINKSPSIIERVPQIADFANIINVIATTAFIFLPALVGWSAMRVFGGNPVLGLVLGLVLMHPQLLSQYDIGKVDQIPTWNIFGLKIEQLNYQGQVLPVLLAAYVLAKIEKGLNKVVHDSIKLLVVGPVALLITGFLAFLIIGPVALVIGKGITDAVTFLFQNAGWFGGAIYGLIYAPLVITGLHHMFLAVDFQLIGSDIGGTYLWPILAMSNIAQGSAAFGAWYIYKKRRLEKEQGLAITSSVSGFLGVTEPAMFGVNLPLKYPFIAAIVTSMCVGALIGGSGVIGKVGVGGLPAILSIEQQFWGVYALGTLISAILPFVLTIIFSKFSKEKAKSIVGEK
ncbi:PTS trehalose transporter subunit IIBC [Staphylococcus felis]|uniref:PTS trehalose transporter subunit IIBC n=1 Tax=Staphylococcus felis TaxID=46127 RepID=A0AAX1RSP5_9STAP|nr:PTS system trehalose-specific EIIBC component [Staphylococcus felis]MDM8327497.1 PTS system trehalose-specific EIIBC component [Staphylococcus felis]MDQ7193173.1 PTS system trehalose-specific EIIBC component [Staphylococcus felis]REH80258.1 PTS trehalose transporter subunit IIBC [Staphylococcus felis]REH82840.1 PTS trehalose transporter subunit IIBC [Staphylococcus felis]REH83175.1 PTS trehalose transporter subunit IIBC [Staphylococcus felis]